MIQADPTDPYARVGQTFPRLNHHVTERVCAYGSEEVVSEDTLLFERGQRGVDTASATNSGTANHSREHVSHR